MVKNAVALIQVAPAHMDDSSLWMKSLEITKNTKAKAMTPRTGLSKLMYRSFGYGFGYGCGCS